MRYELEKWAVRLIEKESLDRPVPGRIVVTAAGFAMFAAEWERSLPLCQQTVARRVGSGVEGARLALRHDLVDDARPDC